MQSKIIKIVLTSSLTTAFFTMPITVLQIKLTPNNAETTIIAFLINIKFMVSTLLSDLISTIIAENGASIKNDNQ